LTEKAQFQAEIEKLVASHALHGSESLCKLLRYLGKQALEHPGVPVKEYQIATEVFGRQPDFDPQLDSMVRVQAGRLRTKLAEYYNTEGATDRVVVEQAKGFLHERLDVSMEDTFRLLRRYAHSSDQHLTDVARRLITQPDKRAPIIAAIRELAPQS